MGASVVNALSSWLEVSIVRDGIEYQEKFKDGGKPDGTLKKSERRGKQLEQPYVSSRMTRFLTTTKFSYDTLAERLRESAFLLRGVKITLTDERAELQQEVFYLKKESKSLLII